MSRARPERAAPDELTQALLDDVSLDRAAGVLLGLACGDALGAGYEFGTPPDADAEMIGGGLGGWAPGEWTDDTQMALCIAEVTATGAVDARAIAGRFLDWYASEPPDVGVQTSRVLAAAAGDPAAVAASAQAYFAAHPDGAAGNGSLMRTAPVALACLGDDAAIADHARAVSDLTHADPLAGDACVLWCVAIDRAVREQRLDGIGDGLALLPTDRRGFWEQRLQEAESDPPATFRPNRFVVTALQAAHAAIAQTPVPDDEPCRHFQEALHAAVRIGDDTDTVAAIAGALLGAPWGASAVPARWRKLLHGWPGYRARDLVRLAVLTAGRGRGDASGWPTAPDLTAHYRAGDPDPAVAVPLPDDPGVVVGNVFGLADVAVDAVVSLCRVGSDQVPAAIEHHETWLDDVAEPEANPNLRFVLADTVATVRALRDDGKRVFLHCAGGRSRAPTVAALYLADRLAIPPAQALTRVAEVLPYSPHNAAFRAVLGTMGRLSGGP